MLSHFLLFINDQTFLGLFVDSGLITLLTYSYCLFQLLIPSEICWVLCCPGFPEASLFRVDSCLTFLFIQGSLNQLDVILEGICLSRFYSR